MTPRSLALLVASLASATPALSRAQWGTPPPVTPNPYGSMQAGGLSPPPPLPSTTATPGAGPTQQELEQAKKQDSRRGLEWVWLNVEGGYSHIGLRTFNPSDESFTRGFVDTTANGGQIGAGVGARLLFFTVGARGRLGFYGPYRIFGIGPEVGLHIPLGKLDPHVDLGGGYTAFAGIKDARSGADSPIAIRGFYIRAGGGLDFYLLPILSLGLNASFELLGLTRHALSAAAIDKLKANPTLTEADRTAADRLAQADTSFGGAFAVTGLVGLHF